MVENNSVGRAGQYVIAENTNVWTSKNNLEFDAISINFFFFSFYRYDLDIRYTKAFYPLSAKRKYADGHVCPGFEGQNAFDVIHHRASDIRFTFYRCFRYDIPHYRYLTRNTEELKPSTADAKANRLLTGRFFSLSPVFQPLARV